MAPTTPGPTFAITPPRDVRVSAAQVPNATSQGAVDIANAQITRRGVELDLGMIGLTFGAAPVVDIHIGTLILSNVSLSAAIDRLRVEGVGPAG